MKDASAETKGHALAELSTRQVAESSNATGLKKNKVTSKVGRGIAKKARQELEEKTGKKVVSNENYLALKKLTKKIGNST